MPHAEGKHQRPRHPYPPGAPAATASAKQRDQAQQLRAHRAEKAGDLGDGHVVGFDVAHDDARGLVPGHDDDQLERDLLLVTEAGRRRLPELAQFQAVAVYLVRRTRTWS